MDDISIFDLPEEWIVTSDPREAIYNDYRDGLLDAKQALVITHEFIKNGLIAGSPSPWWRQFLNEVVKRAQEDSNS